MLPSWKSLFGYCLGVGAALLLLPLAADACAVCGAAQQEASRKAFIGTTAFMTFLPLAILFGVISWFVRRALAKERADAEAIEAGTSLEHGFPSEI